MTNALARKQPHAASEVGFADQKWKGLYRLGGICLVLSGLGGLAASRMASHLYSSGYPSSAAAYLQLVAPKQALANSLWSLWILIDLLLIAPSVALYLVLRRDNRSLALLGTLLVGFYIFYDVSVTELNSLTLVSLSRGYAMAPGDALRAAYVAAATYGYAALPLQTVLSFGVGALGMLLWSVVMLRGHRFPRWAAVFGIVVNGMGLAGAAAPLNPASFVLGLLQYLTVPLSGIWYIAIGVLLYRYSQRHGLQERKGN
jgi:hypothetical protein